MKLTVLRIQWKRIVELGTLCALAFSLAGSVLAAPASANAADRFGWKFEYDDADRVTRVTDPAGRDTRLQYSFDGAKRLRKVVRVRTDEPSISREFDESGRLQSMTDGAGKVSYGYDERGRLNRVQRQGTAAVTYAYDTQDRVTRLQVGDFYRVEYSYDFLGRLAAMKTPAGDIQYEYLTGQGKVVRTLPNGVKTIWEYEPNGRLRQITHADGRNALLAEYTYDYRPDGLIKAIRERSPSGQFVKAYEYDLVGRLVKASGPGGQQYAYEYDAVGNRTKAVTAGKPAQTYTYDWAGRLKMVDGSATEHDAAGNLTSLTLSGTTLRYRHNQDGQLAELPDAKVSYRYDGDANLIGRNAPGAETAFIPDPLATIWRPLVMTAKGGQRTLLVWEGDTPLITIRDGKPEFLLHDHLGSVRVVADGQGRVTQQLDYEPFGAVTKPQTSPVLAPRFAGLFWDPRADLHLARARPYWPELGRFLVVDPQQTVPSGRQTELSIYTYCAGDPINFVDRDGAEAKKVEPPFVVNPNVSDLWSRFAGGTAPTEASRRSLTQAEIDRLLQKYDAYVTKYYMEEYPKRLLQPVPINGWMTAGGVYMNLATNVLLTGSPQEFQRAANSYAWDHLAKEHSGVPFPPFKGPSFKEIANTTVSSSFGEVNVDWATTINMAHASALLMTGTALVDTSQSRGALGEFGTYFSAKDFWIKNREAIPDNSLFQTRYPSADINAVRLDAYLRSGGSLHDVHLRPSVVSTSIGTSRSQGEKKEREREDAGTKGGAVGPGGGGPGGGGPGGGGPGGGGPGGGGPPCTGCGGGPGGGPGGGGGGGPGSPPGSSSFRSNFSSGPSNLTPSPVGGVWLGGSGQMLAGAGLFDGVAVDRNHNLVLIGKGGGQIKLPPLRLDDVVTIFRSVYLHGEGPSVTIDPNPENPEGSAMIVRHGKATENTYVGWVLYQADRLMKGYTLGVDNVTGKEVTTGVSGYARVLETIFFGGESPEKLRQQGHWQRFWIVPAETRRLAGPKKELTLFDVPLAVRTQSMKWDKGKLVDDPQGQSSPGAVAFKDWFTANYDAVAGERLLTPPRESGITSPVPVFTELRRIALITAIAEKLRDQGVPLPFWMRDYEVRPVPFEKTTPGLQVTKSRSNLTARIYGGVNLSVPDKDRKTYTTASEVPAAAKDAPALREKLTLAAALEKGDWPLAAQSEPMKLRMLAQGGSNYQAAALPGAETQALAPARLEEVDLVAPVTGREPIRLVRSYNSFFNPKGPWGSGWALDLPQLEAIQVPLGRNENSVRFQTGYELITPLNSARARFLREEPVAELGGNRLLVPDVPGEFHGIADASPDFLSGPTRVLLRKDGGRWHFSKSGELVAIEQAGSRVVYERDLRGRLTRIVGLLGKRPVASIALRYDTAGRIEGASAKTDQREVAVRYEYDANGRLAAVASDAGRTGYRYDGSLLTAVTRGGAGKDAKQSAESVVQRFEYGSRGQLRAEVGADGNRTEYRVRSEAGESTVSAAHGSGKSAREELVRYDPALRPLEAKYADGTKVAWSYPAGGGMVVDLTSSTGDRIRMSEAADQRSRTVELDGKRKLVSQVDAAGRLTSLADNGQILLRQTWSPDGRLQTAGDESSTAHIEYDADGLVSRVLLAPPGESGKFRKWQATRLDPAGRPVEVTDYTGLQASTDYDDRGQLRARLVKRDGKNYGFQIDRDNSGRVREVKSSWDTSRYAYDSAGLLSRSEVEANGQKSSAEWKAGRLQKVRQFDGGEIALSYYSDAKRDGLPKEIVTPNRLALNYDYDAGSRLAQVAVGRNYRLLLDYDAKGRLAQWSYAAPKP